MKQMERYIIPEVALLQRHRGWLLALGIFLVILGCIGLGMEFFLTLVSMYFFAILLLATGISHLIDAFKYKQLKGSLWQVTIAVLYVVPALVIWCAPINASVMFTALLAWLLIFIGAARIGMAFHTQHLKGWCWLLFAGMASLILGILILIQWPISGLWVIGMFIAIDLIVSGWTYILMARALKPTE